MRWGDKIREMDRNKVFDKLEGLRGALIRAFLIILGLSIVSYFFWKEALHFLQKPLGMPLIMYGLPEAFFVSLRLALFMGIFLASPLIFNGLWGAFAPLFSFNSRRYSLLVVLSATALFYAGSFFCYYLVLPVGINFLVNYGSENLKPMISLSKYMTFSIGLIFAFGLVFELPLIMLILGRVGLVGYQGLAKNRKYALLINSILSAMLTPTPDAYSMLLMMVPVQVLYELSIWLVKIFGKKKVAVPDPTSEESP
ncbi:MAG: twin-arginine translocase subunit TatC [Deltaproteobacteria bacterium]|nr:twin-arginine translocase subunit TatC [Deltaproteobacteria bacterium]